MSTMTLSAADSDICQQFSNSFSSANTTDNLSINSNALQIHMSDLNTFVNTPSPSSVASGGSTRGRSPERCAKNLCSTLKGKHCRFEKQGRWVSRKPRKDELNSPPSKYFLFRFWFSSFSFCRWSFSETSHALRSIISSIAGDRPTIHVVNDESTLSNATAIGSAQAPNMSDGTFITKAESNVQTYHSHPAFDRR